MEKREKRQAEEMRKEIKKVLIRTSTTAPDPPYFEKIDETS